MFAADAVKLRDTCLSRWRGAGGRHAGNKQLPNVFTPFMTKILSIRRKVDEQPRVIASDQEVKELAIGYKLTMGQVRGLIALHGMDRAKLDAAAERLRRY